MDLSIKYIQHNKIDFVKWDACVKLGKADLIYANSFFLNSIHPDWDALVINDYESVFPVTKASKFGIKYLLQPFFTQQLGLIGLHEKSTFVFDACIAELRKRYKYIECNLNYLNSTNKYKAYCTDQTSIILDLGKPYSELKSNYSKNLERNLNKSVNAPLKLISNVDPKLIIDLFKNNKGKELNHIQTHHYYKLELLLNNLLERDAVKINGITDNSNKLIASVAFANHNNKYFFFFSALNQEGKQLKAMPFLINRFIEEHSGQEFLLDFTGSNQKSLARFYKSFGAREYVYLRLKLNDLPWPLNLVKK